MTAAAQVVELFKTYRRPVRQWLRRLSVTDTDIDDLAQEVFIRLWKYDSENSITDPDRYLRVITKNVANDWRLRARNCKPHSSAWLEDLINVVTEDTSNEGCFRNLDQVEINQYVNSLLNKLSIRQREILKLHVFEGKTYKQIAAERGLTYRIVLRELTKAYTYLRNRVVTDGVIK